ncbi:Rpn family recombination-promoting nuclease/putative transposase [Petrotoga sp. Shatin.DS.tank11.9.2.9.3]|jgi:hypothetical protein
MSELNNPHDAFFKKHFGNIKIAQNFLENYLRLLLCANDFF